MIARLIDTAANLVIYFCAATFVATAITAAYLWSAWQLDGEKLARMVAVAQGIEPTDKPGTDVPPEEISYDMILAERARQFRGLELRELALNNAVGQIASQERLLGEQQNKQRQLSQQLEFKLKTYKEGAQAKGMELVRSTLQAFDPSQAKEQIVQMLDADEMDDVVLLLSEMPSSNRADILSEFGTPEENERLADIFRRIRQGDPQSAFADQVMNQLEQNNASTIR